VERPSFSDSVLADYINKTKLSAKIFQKAWEHLPAGVSSSGRFYKPHPVICNRGKGSKVWDVDGNEYIDYLLSYGALILGHLDSDVVAAIASQLKKSLAIGTLTEVEIELADLIAQTVPCAESVRLCNSGTEASMYALRAARAFTGKSKIAKFEGGFHGNHDYALVSVYPLEEMIGPENEPRSVAVGAGIPEAVISTVVTLPYNNWNACKPIIERNASELAAVVVEPLLGFGGGIPAEKEFLTELRRTTSENGIPLIYDEVITGFRLALGGAQEYFGVVPDMVILGKIIGGGFGMGAYAGKKNIMDTVAPTKNLKQDTTLKAFQSGTFNGHPVAAAAGLATLKKLRDRKDEIYSRLNSFGQKMRGQIRQEAQRLGIDMHVTGLGSIFNFHFTKEEPRSYRSALKGDMGKLYNFYLALIANGLLVPPYTHAMISAAHTEEDVERTIAICGQVLKKLKQLES